MSQSLHASNSNRVPNYLTTDNPLELDKSGSYEEQRKYLTKTHSKGGDKRIFHLDPESSAKFYNVKSQGMYYTLITLQ